MKVLESNINWLPYCRIHWVILKSTQSRIYFNPRPCPFLSWKVWSKWVIFQFYSEIFSLWFKDHNYNQNSRVSDKSTICMTFLFIFFCIRSVICTKLLLSKKFGKTLYSTTYSNPSLFNRTKSKTFQ